MQPIRMLCAAIVTFGVQTALAGETTAPEKGGTGDSVEGDDSNENAALEAFEAAKKLYDAERFLEASEQFREAYRLRPTWKLFFNIGQCEAAARRNGLAVEAFERYLAEGGDEVPSSRNELVIAEIKRLRPIIGYLAVSGPMGAAVSVAGVVRGELPLSGPLMVAAGIDHDIVIEQDGETLLARKVKVAGEQTVNVSVDEPGDETATAEEPTADTSTADQPDAAPEPAGSGKRLAGFAMLGIGAALMVAGGATGGIALSGYKQLEKDCPQDVCPSGGDYENRSDRARTLAIATDVLIPTGAVLGTVGIILVVLSKKTPSEKQARLQPVIGPDFGGFMIEGRF